MTISQETRIYLPYCPQCFLFGKCDGPDIVKNPEQQLLGDREDIKETSCKKFQGAKPPTKLVAAQITKEGGDY